MFIFVHHYLLITKMIVLWAGGLVLQINSLNFSVYKITCTPKNKINTTILKTYVTRTIHVTFGGHWSRIHVSSIHSGNGVWNNKTGATKL